MAILITDDSHDHRLLLQRLLKKGGFTDVIFAGSAKEAFEILGVDNPSQVHDVDVILMDILMPEVDGIEACKVIKSKDHLKDIPILMVTGMSDNVEPAFDAGAMDYIVKPVKFVDLRARVGAFMKLKAEIDKRKAREKELTEVTIQLEETNRKLQRLSLIDSLTCIANRRYFDEYLEQEWKRSAREHKSIALLMIDIDFFKFFNDNYGHQNGDECLKKVAKALEQVLKRPGDFVARYGGEEFSIILPNTNLEGAKIVAESMREKIESIHIPHGYSAASEYVTISLGLASMSPERTSGHASLIQEADASLYIAKEQGRNCVRWKIA